MNINDQELSELDLSVYGLDLETEIRKALVSEILETEPKSINIMKNTLSHFFEEEFEDDIYNSLFRAIPIEMLRYINKNGCDNSIVRNKFIIWAADNKKEIKDSIKYLKEHH